MTICIATAIMMLMLWVWLMLNIGQRIQDRGTAGYWTSADGYAEEYPMILAVHGFFTTVINLILWGGIIYKALQ